MASSIPADFLAALALKMLLQFAAGDIGQLTDIRTGLARPRTDGSAAGWSAH
jgi:hypothetical protein